MNTFGKTAIVAALVVVVAVVLVMKNRNSPPPGDVPATPAPTVAPASVVAGLPRFVELGSVTCIPCKMMAPIIEELRKEYPGALQVDFIDVTKDRDAAAGFGIRVIPTQIFLDKDGKELFRHEGFFPKAEIIAKWRELGVDLRPAGAAQTK